MCKICLVQLWAEQVRNLKYLGESKVLQYFSSLKKNLAAPDASAEIIKGTNNLGGTLGVIVIVVGNEHGDTSSNPGRHWLHFT